MAVENFHKMSHERRKNPQHQQPDKNILYPRNISRHILYTPLHIIRQHTDNIPLDQAMQQIPETDRVRWKQFVHLFLQLTISVSLPDCIKIQIATPLMPNVRSVRSPETKPAIRQKQPKASPGSQSARPPRHNRHPCRLPR